MEGPSLSLFLGSENIQLNTNTQGLEEDEEQEDAKQRSKEVHLSLFSLLQDLSPDIWFSQKTKIKDLLDNAFDDLDEESDTSSINDSHYQDSTKGAKVSNTTLNSSQGIVSSKDHTVSQLQKEFDTYDHVDNSNNYDSSIMNHRSELELAPSISSMQRDFNVYGQPDALCSNNNRDNDMHNITAETPYELARPPNCAFPKDMRTQTPANHYAQDKNCSNNGYIDGYENNVHCKQIHEFGGGDNLTSDHINHCYKTSPNGRPTDDDSMAYKIAEYDSKEQLEVLYTVRVKEVKRLTEELQQLQLEKEEEKLQLSRKITLLQADIERSNISRNQTQHALVDAKAEIADLQNQITSLKEKNAILEKTNQHMTEELNIARDSVIELQQKIVVLERVQALQANDKTHEKFLKQAQEKHAIEMKNMQIQIDVLTDKLNAKETSYIALENKLADIRRTNETLMVEKGDTMNRLAQALEESQAQCRNLMATNNAQQVMQLQAQIKVLTQEKEEMQKMIQELQNKLEIAKSDAVQYDSLLATTLEEESDSIRQMKLGDFHNKSKSKPYDDITNKLKGELQRCLAGQAIKRKEITRLENTLSQKEKELDKALTIADVCRQEAARYAKRVNELEQELKSVLTDEALKAKTQIQKLSNHLNDVKKQCESLREEKTKLEQKLKETIAINQETLMKLHQESINQQEKDAIDEYNKEYLEIHAKAVERVRQEAQVEVMQLSVQLEQTQKELDRVKELYIDVCSTKEQLISEHKSEIKMLREKYVNLEEREIEIEKYQRDLQAQAKIVEKLMNECDMYRSKIIDLEKDLNYERKKKDEYIKKIHQEIEKDLIIVNLMFTAKEEALNELRNAHPNQEISVYLPDHCSEHLEKINQLEEDCKRLEDKLHAAVEEQKKVLEYQSALDDAKLKIAQVEISQESWKKKYENAISERNNFITKISKLDSELSNIKRNLKIEDSDVKLKVSRFQVENESLKNKCETLISETNVYKDKISQLEMELSETKKIIANFESRLKKNSEISNSKYELEKDLSHYKDLATRLSIDINHFKVERKSIHAMEQKIKQLEADLQGKEEEIERLKDFEKTKVERDQLVLKLKNQAKQFEQYVKHQKQIFPELNLSPRSSNDGTDFLKIRESMIKELHEEMEQKVHEELKRIEEHNREKRNELEETYKTVLLKLKNKYYEEMQKVIETCRKILLAKQLEIEKLQEELKQKETDVNEEKDVMAKFISEWVREIREIKDKEVEMNNKLQQLQESEENLKTEIKTLKEKEEDIKSNIDKLKSKYQSAKSTANNYKEYAAKREKFFREECKRIEEGYKRAMNQTQQKLDAIVTTQEQKLKEIECQINDTYLLYFTK
ncbi:hypothetical protein E2986_04483 [Frieseomelitta varia]|uniref:Centrosomal protein of 152 kDa n=1 Tax=Frieseomelitta varia TaxID=561572 RepID=A0A833SBG2_9HYME|nr:hypothetical protein E2986_04483 [Frieseomelitta varia]